MSLSKLVGEVECKKVLQECWKQKLDMENCFPNEIAQWFVGHTALGTPKLKYMRQGNLEMTLIQYRTEKRMSSYTSNH